MTDPKTAALKHGVFAVVASGGRELPAVTGAAALASEVDDALAQIEADLGGDLSGAQKEILRACRVPMLVLRLAEAYLIQSGVTDKRGRVRGLLRVVGVYSNTLRHNLSALGLERKIRDRGTIEAYVAEKYGQAERTESETPQGK